MEPIRKLLRKIRRHPTLVVYIFLAFVVILAFYLDARNQANDEKTRCEAGVDNRAVQRQTVEAIYDLATGSIQRDANSPPLTDSELRQYNSYINNVNHFRSSMYRKIKPSEACAPFVKDDNVKPPTPPYPPVRR